MPEKKQNPSFESIMEKLEKSPLGIEFNAVMFAGCQEIPTPQGKVTMPIAIQIEIKFDPRTTPDQKLELLKTLHKRFPIISLGWSTGTKVEPPKEMQIAIDALRKPCSCDSSSKDCSKCR